ncbi:MAG: hypothetical protein PHP50_14065 [Lachnospiraceae bacterium]|nr:hypothetical protein [Lachnospiraceae bacterium]
MSTIEFDFAKARQQQQELESIAQELKSIAEQSMEDTIGGIASAWSGDNAQAYLAKAEKLQTQISRNADKVQNTSIVLGIVSSALQRAEEIAKEIAGSNGGGGGR